MKLLKISLNNTLTYGFIMLMLVSAFNVSARSSTNEKVVLKARTMIENASQDDWETYAKSAELCIQKNVNMKEAFTWLNHSIDLKETTMNLRIKGDYYLKNKLPKKAMEQYLKAIELGKSHDFYFDTTVLQARIDKARRLQKKLV